MEAYNFECLDTSGQVVIPPSHHGLKIRPQLLNHQDLDALNQQLLRAGLTVETARKVLCDTEIYNTVQESGIAIEKEGLEDRIKDLERMISEQMRINNAKVKDLESEVNKTLARENLALKKFEELQKRVNLANRLEIEKGYMEQEHWAEISKRAAHEDFTEKKIAKLQNEMEELIQKHQAAMNVIIDRLTSAEQRLGVFRRGYLASEQPQTASTNPQGKPSTRRGTNPARRCASKYQKRNNQ
ncbi:hypothetical protein BGZ60DRAFT_421883 [Tricladium varicosporioides]|nr:hypothetical protein BGZ60DRAFT_421883 [Hymenoscyphus varicosporioides]